VTIITLGVFDGVHRGHAEILQKLVRRARAVRGTSAAYTFEPHPARILSPRSCPSRIMTPDQKTETLRRQGIQKIVVQRFTRRFSRLSAEDFFRRILVRKLRAREIWIGYNFTFGFRRRGTPQKLLEWGKKAGIRVRVFPSFSWKGNPLSSTRIRSLLARGLVEQATELLGHPYLMEGVVVRGRGYGRGRLGIRTANLKSENERILPLGVYATRTRVGRKYYPSVTNIGCNPTFGRQILSIETHILRFRRNLLRKRIAVEFVKRLRGERTFRSASALAAQIQKDIRVAERVLRRR